MNLPRVSRKEFVILGLLVGRGEMFGLQLVETMPDQLTRGTVYVTLQRMAVKGFVSSRAAPDPAGGPARRMYRATGRGYRLYTALKRELG
ncbi:MAG TPA: PadR family transcriptional regulator [Longimicrobiales bacterium]